MSVKRSLGAGGISALTAIAFTAAAVVFSAACSDNNSSTAPDTTTKVVADTLFLGYADTATKQTTCGNCHVDRQAEWATTKHAHAWADLEGSGHASPACYGCHTTNGNSNLAPDSTGYFAVKANAKPFYQDVQCEACHGPGSHHVAAPGDVQPLSTIVADTGLTTGCGTCHSGAHDPFVEEWRSSGHGFVEPHALGNASCIGCHDGTAALKRFDTHAAFIEDTSATWTAITCAVCHDPHGSSNPAQLRYPINTPDLTTNLCMQCHYRNSAPDPTSTRVTPHSPEGPLLLGEAGWIPQNFADSSIGVSSHGSDLNPRLCAGCHVNSLTATDNLTGQTIYSVGHRFEALPCLTPGGAPDTTTTCSDANASFAACTASGCHATEDAARNAKAAGDARMQYYADQIWIDSNANGKVDTTDGGLLAQVKKLFPNEWQTGNVVTVGIGAQFNTALFRLPGTPEHNPFYAEALAIATIDAVEARYGVSGSSALQTQLQTRAAALGMKTQLRSTRAPTR